MDTKLDLVQKLNLHIQFLKYKQEKIKKTLELESDNKEVRKLMDLISKIFNLGLINHQNYWLLFNQFMSQRLTIKFINQLEFLKGDGEKAFIWLVIEFCTGQLTSLLSLLKINQNIQNNYHQDSYVKQSFEQIYDSIKLLDSLDMHVSSILVGHYKQFEETELEILQQEQELQLQEQQQLQNNNNSVNNSFHDQKVHKKSNDFQPRQSISDLNQEDMKHDYESYRQSVYQQQEQEENDGKDEEEEEEERKLLIKQSQKNFYDPNSDNYYEDFDILPHSQQNIIEKQPSKVTMKKLTQNKSSTIDFDRFLECREQKMSGANTLFNQKFGTPAHDQMLPDFLKQSTQALPQANYDELQEDYDNTGKKKAQILFEQEFQIIAENYSFQDKPVREEPLTLEKQNNKCYLCQKIISKGIYVLCNTVFYCNYNEAFVCDECISNEKRIIPWKVMSDEFDCKSYKISKLAKQQIDELYEKPILLFEYKENLVLKNKNLFEFMILKRSLHLLYDIICNPYLVQDLLQDKKNMVLKENLFSLKNFYEINNGSLASSLERNYKLLQAHVEGCQKCSKKGLTCKICKSVMKVYNFDIQNTTLCGGCHSLYHKKCLENNNCFQCVMNF